MQIIGYDNYSITEQGNIYNLKGHQLKPAINNSGYAYVSLYNNEGIRKNKLVHRLVMQVFSPLYSETLQVNHKDGNKLCNELTNLEMCSQVENELHKNSNGLGKQRRVGGFIDGELKIILNSLTEANTLFNKKSAKTNLCCALGSKGPNRTAYGYTWKYLNDRDEPIE